MFAASSTSCFAAILASTVRPLNLLAKKATCVYVLTWQDDDFPLPGEWLEQGVALLDEMPRLALLGGFQGLVGSWAAPKSQLWSSFHTVRGTDLYRRMLGAAEWYWASECSRIPQGPCRRIPTLASVRIGGGTRAAGVGGGEDDGTSARALVPFMYIAWSNNGPYLLRRSAFLAVGGFNESRWERFAANGVGIGTMALDEELTMRMWAEGFESGLWEPKLERRFNLQERPITPAKGAALARTEVGQRALYRSAFGTDALQAIEKDVQRRNANLTLNASRCVASLFPPCAAVSAALHKG